jgi:two-component system NtrC family sensor kinase
MKTQKRAGRPIRAPDRTVIGGLRILSNQLLELAGRGLPRVEFLRDLSVALIDFFGCDEVEVWLRAGDEPLRYEIIRRTEEEFSFDIVPAPRDERGETGVPEGTRKGLGRICRAVLSGGVGSSVPFFTTQGSFWIGDTRNPAVFGSAADRELGLQELSQATDHGSLAVIPLVVGEEIVGLLQLGSRQQYFFTEFEVAFYEGFAQTLGVMLLNQRARAALRERVKELECLYGMARIVEEPGISLEAVLAKIAALLPPAWQYPDITQGRIVLDRHSYSTPGFRESPYRQTADIVVGGKRRGKIEVVYSESRPELDEGPFLHEERTLLQTVAREVALIIERRQTEEEKARLQQQLRHADRLATIGQLAAGVAHELNEPLGSILGFAQLTRKCQGLPDQVQQDIERIEKASLHAREVVRKLMLFARQMPPQKAEVDANQLVEEGLYFLESRCAKEGIELIRSLGPKLRTITADRSQLHQVLVNLVVNAIQAMPGGGTLTVSTRAAGEEEVSITVEDTGTGMSQEALEQIFVPFFTTKDVTEGTGLGLAVVHGIVSSHGGTIRVESEPGRGSRFEIRLPVAARDHEEGKT